MTTKRIKRSSTADGNLVKVGEAKFLSLVGLPANQRPFQVIRSQKPVQRGETAILMLTLPDDYTEEDALGVIAMFDMDGYSVVADSDGHYCICRNDLQSVAKVEALKPAELRLTDDITAHIDSKQYQPKEVKRGCGVVVVGVEFDKKTFDNEKIISWGHENSVDISEVDIENSTSDVFSVSRMEVPAGTEVRRMELEAGLTVQVAREADLVIKDGWVKVPDGYVTAVSEAAYGQWGWGQVDFAASMADVAFCELVDDANRRLWDVLYNIMFYSYLPLDARKQLVTRCLSQYEAFVHDLIDQLPRQVFLLASRADSIKRKDSEMAIDAEKAKKELAEIEAKRAADEQAKKDAAEAEAKRSADAAAATAAAATEGGAAAPAGDEKLNVTRAELTQMIADGVKAAKEAEAAEAKRAADEKAAADKAAADAAAAATAQRSEGSGLSKEDMAAVVAAAIAPLTAKIERMEATSTAVVRSDAGDDAAAGTKDKEGKQANVFRGVFGFGGQQASE